MTAHPVRLGHATTTSIGPAPLVFVPLGSTEQHGPHLPLDVDARVAEHLAMGIAAGLPDWTVRVAPAMAYGSSGEHQGFAGTISIGSAALRLVLVELVRSLGDWASGVVFVNGHGGNAKTVVTAVRQLRAEGHDASWIACGAGWVDAHAGRTETSLMLAIAPELVRPFAGVTGNRAPIAELMPELAAGGVRAVSPSGVLGDPAGATGQEGARVLAAMIQDGIERCRSGRIDCHGQRVA